MLTENDLFSQSQHIKMLFLFLSSTYYYYWLFGKWKWIRRGKKGYKPQNRNILLVVNVCWFFSFVIFLFRCRFNEWIFPFVDFKSMIFRFFYENTAGLRNIYHWKIHRFTTNDKSLGTCCLPLNFFRQIENSFLFPSFSSWIGNHEILIYSGVKWSRNKEIKLHTEFQIGFSLEEFLQTRFFPLLWTIR